MQRLVFADDRVILHATLVARRCEGRWRGVLVRGPSGAGKSELALRAVAAGWRLVADDRVRLWTSGEQLFGAAPPALAGLVEARGLGVLREPALAFAAMALVVDACDAPERLPDPDHEALLGVALPRVRLALREPSAVAKLGRALDGALDGALGPARPGRL